MTADLDIAVGRLLSHAGFPNLDSSGMPEDEALVVRSYYLRTGRVGLPEVTESYEHVLALFWSVAAACMESRTPECPLPGGSVASRLLIASSSMIADLLEEAMRLPAHHRELEEYAFGIAFVASALASGGYETVAADLHGHAEGRGFGALAEAVRRSRELSAAESVGTS